MKRPTVLCAIDVNEPEDAAAVLRQAAQLATLEDAQLDVITVVPDFGMSMVGSFFDKGHQQKMIEEVKERLKETVTEALGAKAEEATRLLVTSGKAYAEILRVAEADRADLIVIGAHKPGFSDYLLGPNAARVVRHSNCSVYVVR